MARAFRKGSISFGLVSIPVALHTAGNGGALSFHPLDRRDLNPVGYKRVNKRTDEDNVVDRMPLLRRSLAQHGAARRRHAR